MNKIVDLFSVLFQKWHYRDLSIFYWQLLATFSALPSFYHFRSFVEHPTGNGPYLARIEYPSPLPHSFHPNGYYTGFSQYRTPSPEVTKRISAFFSSEFVRTPLHVQRKPEMSAAEIVSSRVLKMVGDAQKLFDNGKETAFISCWGEQKFTLNFN